MNIDPEELLRRLRQRPANKELRQQVLMAVANEWRAARQRRWMRRVALATAALLVFSVGANWWASSAISDRLARLYEVHNSFDKADNAKILLASQERGELPPPNRAAQYLALLQQRIIAESAFCEKERRHEKMEQNPSWDGSRSRNLDGMHSPSGCRPYLDYRHTA